MFQTLNSSLFGFIFIILAFAFLTANLVYWLRYIIGEPQATSSFTAEYSQSAILSFIGKWVSKQWQNKQIQIHQIAQQKAILLAKESQPDLNPHEHPELIQSLKNGFLTPNIYNAFGVCIYCFATWVSLLFLAFFWALSLTFFDIDFSIFYISLSLPLFWAQVLFFIKLNYGDN